MSASGWCISGQHGDCRRVFLYGVCSCACHPEPTEQEQAEASARYAEAMKGETASPHNRKRRSK